jgi:2-aminoethylphosphonate-pyruvate transaminase
MDAVSLDSATRDVARDVPRVATGVVTADVSAGVSRDLALELTNPYLLLTPGPLSTSPGVRTAMLRDWCTWDDDYKALTQEIRRRLVALACPGRDSGYTCVLMQGSGTFAIEATLGTVIPQAARLLIFANGAYGWRLAEIARAVRLNYRVIDFGDLSAVDPDTVAAEIDRDGAATHVAFVHCETTSGILNPLEELAYTVKRRRKTLIVDAMSSFGGIPLDMAGLGIDFLVSSANKCIQGVPGFAFVVARTAELQACAGRARSHSLDLLAQWETMERDGGKWRFTSPTHTVHAFYQALLELEEEGGILKRWGRYCTNQTTLVRAMRDLGFVTVVPDSLQSPIITSFYYPLSEAFSFPELYGRLKRRGFVIYPGKVSELDTFRIANIGAVFPTDIERLKQAVAEERFW